MNQITIIILEKIGEAITAINKLDAAELGLKVPKATDIPPAPGNSVVPGPPVAEPDDSPDPEPTPDPKIEGIEVDAEGIPWDARIHSGAKTKLAKKNTWKLLRGIDPVIVAKVKTELLKGIESETDTSSGPMNLSVPPEVMAPATMTWVELLKRIAGAALDSGVVDAACTKYGAPNISALQDTPALVPLVAKDLGFTNEV